MRYLIAALSVAAATACAGTPAQAQNYPWCEYLGGGEGGGGGRNCGFVSFEQCMESARGNGSDCRQNTQYEAPAGPHSHQTGVAPAYRTHHAKRTTHKNS
jgi:hypothetical protein